MKMMMMFRAAAIATALAVPMAATTSAQPNVVVGGGLVNVQVTDIIDDVTVQDINVNVGVALQIAANVCGVAVGVLAQDLADGTAACETAEQTVELVTLNR